MIIAWHLLIVITLDTDICYMYFLNSSRQLLQLWWYILYIATLVSSCLELHSSTVSFVLDFIRPLRGVKAINRSWHVLLVFYSMLELLWHLDLLLLFCSNALLGSAVCVFNMSAFTNTFNGPFKFQENARYAWERHTNKEPLLKVRKDWWGKSAWFYSWIVSTLLMCIVCNICKAILYSYICDQYGINSCFVEA